MADPPSIYLDPGVYQQEELNPQSLALSPLAFVLAIVGIAPRVKTVFNEPIRRGQIRNEALTVAGSSPHTATLVNRGNRRQQDSVLRRGTDILPDIAYSYLPATLTGSNGPFNIPANSFVTLSLDKRGFLAIALTAGAAQTAANVVSDINTALAASPLYGAAYATAASVSGSAVKITSPSAAPDTDLRFLFTPAAIGTDQANLIFGIVVSGSAGFIAPTIVQIADAYWDATAAYTLDYIALDTVVDPLANTNIQSITSLGLFSGVTSFLSPTDYTLTGNNVDWTVNTQATLSSLDGTFNIVLGVNDKLRFSLNGIAVVTLTLTAGAARTATQIAGEINTFLAAQAAYGPLYAAVASVSGAKVVLTLPKPFNDLPLAQGATSLIELFATPANVVTTIFGIATAALPYEKTGSSNQPVPGALYFVTYTYTRPASDYNNAGTVTQLFTRPEDALAYTGPLTKDNLSVNRLGIAATIAFDNDAPRVLLIQVDDSTSPGFPTVNQVKAAIDAAKNNSGITDLVVLDTRLATQTYLLNHVTQQSSLTEKNYRRGWYGMARNTPVGDRDTADTFVYRAQRTLQVPPDSPGRGRAILCAPPNVSRMVRLSDGSDLRAQLDSTFVAVAVAARQTSFTNAATSLLRKTVQGFELDDFQVYQKADRRTLASSGVCVVTADGGRFVLTDPVTTEQGAGNLIEFVEISAIAQKDRVVRVVDQVLDTNIVGIVPTDIQDFTSDIKGFIMQALVGEIEAGNIARYKDQSGNVRDINLSTDIQVFQNPNDPRKFDFRYWFNLRYPAKWLYGVWSVDNPFFSAASNVQTA
jgi:hypothetical protein